MVPGQGDDGRDNSEDTFEMVSAPFGVRRFFIVKTGETRPVGRWEREICFLGGLLLAAACGNSGVKGGDFFDLFGW